MMPKNVDYSAWIKWIVVIIVLLLAYSITAKDLDIVESEEKDGVAVQEAITKKGIYIIRLNNYRNNNVICYLYNEEEYFYTKIRVRADSISDWYRGPVSGRFNWYCQ